MPKTREEKAKIIEDLNEKISRQKAVVFIDYSGIKTKDLSEIREKLKESAGELRIIKKSLTQLVFKKAGFDIDIKKIKAQIALVFGFKDEISPAKIVYQFSEKNSNLKILGGIFENKFIGAEKVVELAKLPTKEELLANFLSGMKAPISNFVYALQANLKGLIYVLSIVKK